MNLSGKKSASYKLWLTVGILFQERLPELAVLF